MPPILPSLDQLRQTRTYQQSSPDQRLGMESRLNTDMQSQAAPAQPPAPGPTEAAIPQQHSLLPQAPQPARQPIIDTSFGLPSERAYQQAEEAQRQQQARPAALLPRNPAEFSAETAQPERTWLGTAGDVGVGALKTSIGFTQGLQGLANIPTLGKFGQLTEKLGYKPAEAQEILDSMYSPAQQYASRQVNEAKGFIPTIQKSLEYPSTIVQAVGESSASMLGGMGAGKLILSKAPTLVTALSGRLGMTAEAVAGAIGEGVISAGALAEGIREQTEKGDLSLGQSALALAGGIGTGVLSMIGGKISDSGGFADIDSLFIGSGAMKKPVKAAKAIVAGGITEGLEEMPQEIQEQVVENAALDRPLMQGVPESAAQALLAGTAMGSGANIIAGVAGQDSGIDDQGETTTADTQPVSQPPVTDTGTASEMIETVINGLNTGQLNPDDPAQSEIINSVREQMRAVAESPSPEVQEVVAQNRDVLEQIGALEPEPVGAAGEQQADTDQATQFEAGEPQFPEEVALARAQAIHPKDRTPEEAKLVKDYQERVEAEELAIRRARAIDDQYRTTEEREIARAAEQREQEGYAKEEIKAGQTAQAAEDRKLTEKRVKAEAEEFSREHPAHRAMTEAIKQGGINLDLARKEGWDLDTLKDVRRPGLFSKNATMGPDEMAQTLGYDSEADMRAEWVKAPTKKELKGRAEAEYTGQDQAIQESVSSLEKEGFELGTEDAVNVGDLNPGDEVVVMDRRGVPDKLTHKGYAEDGDALLQDGVTIKADPFEEIKIIAKKTGDTEASKIAQQKFEEILEETDPQKVKSFANKLPGEIKNNPKLKPFQELIEAAVDRRLDALDDKTGSRKKDKEVQPDDAGTGGKGGDGSRTEASPTTDEYQVNNVREVSIGETVVTPEGEYKVTRKPFGRITVETGETFNVKDIKKKISLADWQKQAIKEINEDHFDAKKIIHNKRLNYKDHDYELRALETRTAEKIKAVLGGVKPETQRKEGLQPDDAGTGGKGGDGSRDTGATEFPNKRAVETALRRGEDVPQEVMEQYPELAPASPEDISGKEGVTERLGSIMREEGKGKAGVRRELGGYRFDPKKFHEQRRNPEKLRLLTDNPEYKRILPENTEKIISEAAKIKQQVKDAEASLEDNKAHLVRFFDKSAYENYIITHNGIEYNLTKPEGGESYILTPEGKDAKEELYKDYQESGKLKYIAERGVGLRIQPNKKPTSKVAPYATKTFEQAAREHIDFVAELAEAKEKEAIIKARFLEEIAAKLPDNGMDHVFRNKETDTAFNIKRNDRLDYFIHPEDGAKFDEIREKRDEAFYSGNKKDLKKYEKQLKELIDPDIKDEVEGKITTLKESPGTGTKKKKQLGSFGVGPRAARGFKGEGTVKKAAEARAAAEAELDQILKSISGTPLPQGQRADIMGELTKQLGRGVLAQQKRGVFEVVSPERAAQALATMSGLKKSLSSSEIEQRKQAAREIREDVESVGREITIHRDGTITVHHRTTVKNANLIKENGFNDGSFFSLTKQETEGHTKQNRSPETVMSIRVDPRDISFSTGTQEFYAENKLVNENGIWSTGRSTSKKGPVVTDVYGDQIEVGGMWYHAERIFGKPASSFSVGDTVPELAEAKYSKDGQRIEALYFPKTGKVWLVDGNIEKGEAVGVLAHDLGVHALQLGFKETEAFERILKRVNYLVEKGNDPEVNAARQRAIDAKTPANQLAEETLGYLMNNAKQHNLVRRLWAALKRFLSQKTNWDWVSIKKFTPVDMQAMAQSAVRADMLNTGEWSPTDPDIMKSMSTPAQEARRNTENLNATKDGQTSTTSAADGEKAIQSIMRTLRKVTQKTEEELEKEKTKERKFLDQYRQVVNNQTMPIDESVSLLNGLVRQADIPDGSKKRIGQLIKSITAAKRPETQRKRLNSALETLRADISKRLRSQIRAQVKRAAGPKREGVIKRGRYWHEQEKDITAIREIVHNMSPEQAIQAIARVENRLDGLHERLKGAAPENAEAIRSQITDAELRLHHLRTFGGLKDKSLEGLLNAKYQIEELRRLGRSKIRAVKEAWQQEIDRKTNWLAQEITGQDDPRPETVVQYNRRKQKEKTLVGKAKGAYQAVENSIQSWEHLLDRITIKSGKKIFQSRAVKELGSISHFATHEANRLNRESIERTQSKGLEIFGVKKSRTLVKRLQKLAKKTGKIQIAGDTLQLSPMEAAYFYNVRKESGSEKLFRKMGFTSETWSGIDSLMTKELKAWADYLHDDLLADALQGETEAYRAVNGVDRVPARLLRDDQTDIPVMNLNSAIMNRIFDANHYRAWAVPSKTFNDLFSVPETRGYIEQYAGTSTLKALDKFLEDFAKTPRELRGDMAWMDKLRSNVVMSMIGANPTTFFKQLTSIPAYAADIPTAAFVKNFAHGLANFGAVRRMIKDSQMAQERFGSGYDRDIHEASKATAEQVIGGKITNMRDLLMAMTKLGDMAAVYAGYTVYKYHYDKNGGSKNHKEAHRIGIEEFERATERTQQAAGVKDRGSFERGSSLQKLLTMYMTSPAAYTRQTMAALRHFKTDPVGSSKRLLLFNVMLPMAFQAVASGFVGASGEDDEQWEEFWAKELRAVALGPFLGLPIARDIAAGLWDSALGEWYGSDVQHSPVTETTKSLTQAVFHASKGLREFDDEAIEKAKSELLDFLGYAAGLPIKPGRRMKEGLDDFLSGDTEHPWLALSGYSRAARDERYLGD